MPPSLVSSSVAQPPPVPSFSTSCAAYSLDEADQSRALDAFEHPNPSLGTKADEIVRRLEEEAIPSEYDCAICLGELMEPQELECGHAYCNQCLLLLRKKGVQQSCPLCRAPLPLGPEQLFDMASRCGHLPFPAPKAAMRKPLAPVVKCPPPTVPSRCESNRYAAQTSFLRAGSTSRLTVRPRGES